jgi:hypothetical protein
MADSFPVIPEGVILGIYVWVASTYGLYLNNVIKKQGDAIDLTGQFRDFCPIL